MSPSNRGQSGGFLAILVLAVAAVTLLVLVTAADDGQSTGFALKPLKCVDRYAKAGVTLDCFPDNAGPFKVRGLASTGYRLNWLVICFDQHAENGMTARGSRIVNGWFTLAVNRKSAPRAYRLMAEGFMCGIDITFRAFKPKLPHSVRGVITWAHNLPTAFDDVP